jgi:predicted 3-demethylubiquinone-9 3-methyltransferase (glyoxalase superfamily)
MNNPIYPCLWFDGKAKEAAEFYCSVFRNSKITTENPMVVTFELSGKKFMGLNGGPSVTINPSVSITAVFETIEETNAAWEKLIDGGSAMIAIDKHPWSERYGWLKDKFGMTWQITIGKPGQPHSVTPSLLFTDKLFGRAEEAIQFYSTVFENSSNDVLIHYPPGDANAGKVMYAEFKLDGYDLIIMDGPGEHNYTFNWGVSLVVNCETQAEIDHYWDALIAGGGEESQCGWLKDKFGVSWQIVPAILGKLMSDPERFERVMKEVMQMKKLDIARMENA